MKTATMLISTLVLLICSATSARANGCAPAVLEIGGRYKVQLIAAQREMLVHAIETGSCWADVTLKGEEQRGNRAQERLWVNLSHLVSIEELQPPPSR